MSGLVCFHCLKTFQLLDVLGVIYSQCKIKKSVFWLTPTYRNAPVVVFRANSGEKKRKTPLKGLKTVPGKGSREQNIKLSGILQRAGASKVTLRQND